MKVTMPGGVGILVPEPLAAPDEVQSRLPVTVDVKEKLGQRWYLYFFGGLVLQPVTTRPIHFFFCW